MTFETSDAIAPIPILRLARYEAADNARDVTSKTVVYLNSSGEEEKSKFFIRVYSNSPHEDLYALFTTLDSFLSWARAEKIWPAHQDASKLFQEFRKILKGRALTQWEVTVSRLVDIYETKTWSLFKQCLAHFIVHKIVDRKDAYSFQKKYLESRPMPDSLEYFFLDYFNTLFYITEHMFWLLDERQIITLFEIQGSDDNSKLMYANSLLYEANPFMNMHRTTGLLSEASLIDIILRAVPKALSDDFKRTGGSTETPLETVKDKMNIYDEIRKRKISKELRKLSARRISRRSLIRGYDPDDEYKEQYQRQQHMPA